MVMVATRWLHVPQAANCQVKVLSLHQSSAVSNGVEFLLPNSP